MDNLFLDGGHTMKRHIPKIILCIIPILLIAGFIALTSTNQVNINKQIKNSTENNGSDYCFQISISKSWEEYDGSIGAQYDAYIYNNTSFDMKNWSVEIHVPDGSYIDSGWDGDYIIQDGVLTVTPKDYNQIFFSNDSRKFGFIMYTPGEYMAENAVLKGTSLFEYKESPLYYFLITASGTWGAAVISFIIASIRLRSYRKHQEHDRMIIVQSINTFTNFIDAKDQYTKGHSARVAEYAKEIAKRLQFPDEKQQNLYYVALMHDVGKIGISDSILNKAGSLTPEERKIIESHTTIGGEMLKSFTAIPGIAAGALYHHERYDGKGYPSGLAGNAIPLYARIICIADSYDAMSSNRCYRNHLEKDKILSELHTHAGTQFDPDIVVHMIDMIHDGTADRIAAKYKN